MKKYSSTEYAIAFHELDELQKKVKEKNNDWRLNIMKLGDKDFYAELKSKETLIEASLFFEDRIYFSFYLREKYCAIHQYQNITIAGEEYLPFMTYMWDNIDGNEDLKTALLLFGGVIRKLTDLKFKPVKPEVDNLIS